MSGDVDRSSVENPDMSRLPMKIYEDGAPLWEAKLCFALGNQHKEAPNGTDALYWSGYTLCQHGFGGGDRGLGG